MEKNKAVSVLDLLRSNKPKLGFERLEQSEVNPEFLEALGGGSADEIKSAEEGGSDVEYEASNIRAIARCEGDNQFTQIASGDAQAKPEKLTSDGVYFITRGNLLLAWLGADAPKDLKTKAMILAVQYLESVGMPNWIPISRMNEGSASEDFDIIFA